MTRRLPDPTTRRLVAQIGGYARVQSAESPSAMTAPARAARLRNLERQVDPDGTLPPDVLAVKVRAALSEQMSRVSLARVRSAQARREKAPASPASPALALPPAEAEPTPTPMTWAEFLAARGLAADPGASEM